MLRVEEEVVKSEERGREEREKEGHWWKHWNSSTPHDTIMQYRYYVTYSALHKHINFEVIKKFNIEQRLQQSGKVPLYCTQHIVTKSLVTMTP